MKKKRYTETFDSVSNEHKKEKLGDEYNVYVSKIHLCKHCGQIIITHKDTVKIFCPDCNKFTQIIPNK